MGQQSPRCGVLPGHHRARPRVDDPGAVAHRTLGPAHRQHLRRWITAAKRSRINAFVALAKRLQVYFNAVITAIELGISNALIEGINAKIRLINARGYGHHSAQALSSMIYLCLGGLHPKLPTRT